MKLEELDEDQKYVLILGLQLGFFFKARDLDEDTFMNYCKGIWDTIELQEDWTQLRDLISDSMAADIPEKIKEWEKRQSS